MQYDELKSKINRILQKFRQRHHIPGIIVAWSISGNQDFVTWGLGNLEEKLPLTLKSRFQIGNLTEIFTGYYGLQQFTQDKEYRGSVINLNTSVTKLFKGVEIEEYAWSTRYIELSNLLSHSSGIGEYRTRWDSLEKYNSLRHSASHRRPNLNSVYETQVIQVFSPKSQWYQSEHNYGILGAILEKINAKPLSQQFDEELFALLDFTSTTFDFDNHDLDMRGYKLENHKIHRINQEYSVTYPSSGLISTPEEILIFLDHLISDFQFHYEDYDPFYDEFKPPTVFNSVFQQHEDLCKTGYPFIIRNDEPRIAEYSSNTFGISSKVIVFLDYELSIVISANRGNIHALDSLGDMIVKQFCVFLDINLPDYLTFNDYTMIHDTENDGLSKDMILAMEGYYRTSNKSTLLRKYKNYFGVDLVVEGKLSKRKKRRKIVLKSSNISKIHRELTWIGGNKSLYGYKNVKNGRIFLYKSNGSVYRSFFPKTISQSSYMYIENPVPILLYWKKSRSKLNQLYQPFDQLFRQMGSRLFFQYAIPASYGVKAGLGNSRKFGGQMMLTLSQWGLLASIWLGRNSIIISRKLSEKSKSAYQYAKPFLIKAFDSINKTLQRSNKIIRSTPNRVSYHKQALWNLISGRIALAIPKQSSTIKRKYEVYKKSLVLRKYKIAGYKDEYYSHINFDGDWRTLLETIIRTNRYRAKRYLITRQPIGYTSFRTIKEKLKNFVKLVLEG